MENKIANIGIHHYCPQVGERKPIVQIEGYRLPFGIYCLDTPLELKGPGITFSKKYKEGIMEQYKIGWNHYEVTHAALEKLADQYAILIESWAD